jgi:predicted lipoprotein
VEEYNKFFDEFKEDIDHDNLEKALYNRNWQSFDENVLREWYDGMSLESDFNDEVSHSSFP